MTILVVIGTLQIGISNYCFSYLKRWEQAGFIISSVLGLIALLTKSAAFFYAGWALFGVSMVSQVLMRKRLKIEGLKSFIE